MSNQDQSGQLLAMDSKELARELRLSPLTVSRMERQRPGELPPCLLVGRGQRLYPRDGVVAWFHRRAGIGGEAAPAAPAAAPAAAAKRGRGRPRNEARSGGGAA